MTVTINGTTGITSPEVALDNGTADGGQVVLKSSGYSNWNIDNYSGSLRAYYNATEYMRMDSSGNLGIGTSSPSQLLSIASSAAAKINIKGYSAATGIFVGMDSATDAQVWNAQNGILRFATNDTERMRIDSSGRLLIGTTTDPWNVGALVASSSGHTAYLQSSASSGYAVMTIKRSGATSGDQLYFYTTSGLAGIIASSGTSTTYGTSSDYRLKEDIKPMIGALDRIALLKPVTYKWKATGSNGEGFIAHELQEVIPEAVIGEKDAVDEKGDIKPQNIDTSFLVATLTAAIQELKAELDTVKTELATLKGTA